MVPQEKQFLSELLAMPSFCYILDFPTLIVQCILVQDVGQSAN
jgi:hypothetical protein